MEIHQICIMYVEKIEKNSINTSIFKDYANITHSHDRNNVDMMEVPKNQVIIEAAIFEKNNERYCDSFKSKVDSKCGDVDAI